MNKEARVGAFLRGETILIHPYFQESNVKWVGFLPLGVLSSSEKPEKIGEAVASASEDSWNSHPPTDQSSFISSRYKAVGVQSEDEFDIGTKCLGISFNGNRIILRPTKYWRECFQDWDEREFSINKDSSLEEIGKAVIRGWELCEAGRGAQRL